jgi:topoisomerase-4 subunit A
VPFKSELVRDVSDEDVEHLLSIPIRRISLFDINKNKEQVNVINGRLKEIARRLKKLTACAVEYLQDMIEKFQKLADEAQKDGKDFTLDRHTKIASFSAVDVKEVAKRDLPLRYDEKGYLGTSVYGGTEVLKVTPFDRVFIMRHSGIYSVCDVPEKLFVDTGMWYCNYADKEIISNVLFTVIYRDPKTKFCFIKRCRIPSWIMNRDYLIAPDGMEVLHVDTREKFTFTLHYTKKPRMKIKEESFNSADFEEKGHKTQGIRLSDHETDKVEVASADGQLTLI